MPTLKTEGIILRRSSYQEHDRIFTILTADLGKIHCGARGVRKIKSKLAGHLEPGTVSELMLAYRHLGRYRLATSVEAIKKNTEISFASRVAVSHLLELTDRAISEEQKDNAVYQFLRKNIELLHHEKFQTARHASLICRIFSMKLLAILGYRPELLSCIFCGRKIFSHPDFFSHQAHIRAQQRDDASEVLFFPAQGGLAHAECKKLSGENNQSYFFSVSHELIRWLWLMLGEEMEDLLNAQIPAKVHYAFASLSRSFLQAHLEKKLKSEIWLTRIEEEDLFSVEQFATPRSESLFVNIA